MTSPHAESFIEILPATMGYNLRHFGPTREHTVGGPCDCDPDVIPHLSNQCPKCGSDRIKIKADWDRPRRYCVPCRREHDKRKRANRLARLESLPDAVTE